MADGLDGMDDDQQLNNLDDDGDNDDNQDADQFIPPVNSKAKPTDSVSPSKPT